MTPIMCWRPPASRWCPSSIAFAAADFTFRGREVVLPPNMAGDPSVLHGQGWLEPVAGPVCGRRGEPNWRYEHEAGEWPWTYEARQHFALDEGGLTVRLSCLNTSTEPMPCGLGQHPYFPCGAGDACSTPRSSAPGKSTSRCCRRESAGDGPLRPRRSQGLRAGARSWLRRLERQGADQRPGLAGRAARCRRLMRTFFQLYSPKSGGLFVAEPVSHANAALNAPEEEWAELGLRVLEPGEEMNLVMRIDVRPG